MRWIDAIKIGVCIDHPTLSFIIARDGFVPPYNIVLVRDPYISKDDLAEEEVDQTLTEAGLNDDQWTIDTDFPYNKELLPVDN